uniref:Uncharacterized protein n=1 Tax=Haemonchus contortus TaxID=6289 RepID=A0A7I4Y4X5_HAECO
MQDRKPARGKKTALCGIGTRSC